ncbi:MAG: DUF4279 domain-containing protein [Pseudomonadota bacterium]
MLDATDTEPENLDAQVLELITKLSADMAQWKAISSKFRVDLFCGWFMETSSEGTSLSHDTLRSLGERGIELSLCIYSADTPEPPAT